MDTVDEQIEALVKAGVSFDHVDLPLSGMVWFEHFAGTRGPDPYWRSGEWSNRDEFFLLAGTCFHAGSLLGRLPAGSPWRTEFDVAGLFVAKLNAQSVLSIDLVTRAGAYADAFALLRPLAARCNLLLLCALEPRLFDRWLKEPNLVPFREREIQSELSKHGLRTMAHVYDYTSELVHNHFQALGEVGYFEHGLFPRIPAVENRIYVTAKYLLGVIAWTMVSALRADRDGALEEDLSRQDALQRQLHKDVLADGRIDHLTATIAEERHWRKTGKDAWDAGGMFAWTTCEEVIAKCRRASQPKRVGKKYLQLVVGSQGSNSA